MAKGLNRAELICRLGQDVEIRYSQSGVAVVNLSAATNHSVKRGDVYEDATEWHRLTVFGKMAEACAEYLSKGSQIYISGRLQTRNWIDKNDIKRWATEIICSEVIFLDSKGTSRDRPPTPPPADEDARETGRGEDNSQAGGYDANEESSGGMESGDIPF